MVFSDESVGAHDDVVGDAGRAAAPFNRPDGNET